MKIIHWIFKTYHSWNMQYIWKMSRVLSENRKDCTTGNRTERFNNPLPLH